MYDEESRSITYFRLFKSQYNRDPATGAWSYLQSVATIPYANNDLRADVTKWMANGKMNQRPIR